MWPHKSKYRRAFYVSKPKQRGPKPKPNMESLRITKKHKKHLNNPFPSTPTPIAFLVGTLTFNPQTLPPHQIYSIGHDFQLSWQSKDGGCLSISHKSQPTRPIWSTIPGQAFVSAAMAETEVEESRGSFFIRDRDVRLVCDHQTIDHIRVLFDQSDCDVDTIDHDFSSGYGELYQEIGIKDKNFPVLVITGKIFCFGRGKSRIENRVLENPDFSQSTYAKYWILFDQKNSDQIGFQVKIGKPNFDMYQRTTSPKLSYSFPGFSKRLGRLRIRPLGWCCNSRKRRSFSPAASTNEEHLMKDSECANFNRVCLTYSSEKNERFYGFGEQFSHMNFKGKRVPIFVQEQGIGRGDQPITFAANLVSYRAGGDWSTTYAPSPFYVTSKMKSLYLEGYKYSVFDLTRHDRVQIQTHGDTVQGRILNGSSPLEFIEHFTEAIGRPPELPEWIISGAVVGMQGGTDFVREIWAKLQRYDVPISAFWLQDWVGQRKTVIGSQLWWNWEVDTARYSGWKHLIRDHSACNIKVMTYCNPCLAPMDEKANKRRHLFEEAKKLGILVKDSEGNPYMVPNTAFDVGMLDLTHPHTAGWFKQVLQEMVDEGVSGWMADFGEGLPVDASLYSGEDPISAHNRYPELWAKLNREFVEECKSNTVAKENNTQDALVFFMRAGFTNSPKWAMLFWEGDQMVSWQANDGIKSAVVGLLSSGLSGYAFNHSDIGGYCAVSVPFLKYQRSDELLLRWMELNAFTTVYRTHEGNKPSFNSQFYSNDKTLSQFSRFAKVYKAWKFYRVQLVEEASKRGWPVYRHLFLHYPDDERVHSLRYEQFLVGEEILVVPVLDKGKKKVKVYFPIGEMSSWKHIWTGNVYSKQGCEVWVEAPIGYPAVFVKAGSVIGETFLTFLREYGVL